MYRLYIDETGNSDLGSSADPNHRFLSLTGVLISKGDAARKLHPKLEQLKGDLFDSHPDEPIILHRKDIKEGKHPFQILRNPEVRARFDARIMELFREVGFQVITAIIDKQEHLRRYKIWRHDPYHYCLEVLLERYALWLHYRSTSGDVWGEVRGGKHDKRLEKSFARLHQNGTTFVRPEILQAHLTSGRIKLRPKSSNVAGLQIADLLAHPSALYARDQKFHDVNPGAFAAQIIDMLVRARYNRSARGRIDGYGLKWLP